MLKVTRQFVIFAAVLCAWAATPVARVSSSQPFKLNGATVPVEGIPSWPLAAGDVVTTQAAQATVVFRGGSRIVLEPNSELKIEIKDNKPVVRLLHGSGKYFIAGAIVALSTKAALVLSGGDNKTPDTPAPPQPPNPSPSN
jgi:hypothetical protein